MIQIQRLNTTLLVFRRYDVIIQYIFPYFFNFFFFFTGNVISGQKAPLGWETRLRMRAPFHPFGSRHFRSKHPKKGREIQLPVAHARTRGNQSEVTWPLDTSHRDLRSGPVTSFTVTSDQGHFRWRHFRSCAMVRSSWSSTKATWKPLIYYSRGSVFVFCVVLCGSLFVFLLTFSFHNFIACPAKNACN